jgi:hypothetical protein
LIFETKTGQSKSILQHTSDIRKQAIISRTMFSLANNLGAHGGQQKSTPK